MEPEILCFYQVPSDTDVVVCEVRFENHCIKSVLVHICVTVVTFKITQKLSITNLLAHPSIYLGLFLVFNWGDGLVLFSFLKYYRSTGETPWARGRFGHQFIEV